MNISDEERQLIVDREHLRLLSIFYYIRAACTALVASIPLIHVFMGLFVIVMASRFEVEAGEPSPAWFGWLFVGIGSMVFVLGWAFAVLQFLAARCIAARRRRVFCLVAAALSCLAVPYGTILGVMTFIVLSRPAVKRIFTGSGQSKPENEK